MLFSLAAVFAAPARHTAGRTSDLVATDEVQGPAPGWPKSLWPGQESCGPGPGHFWVVGSHHKTGTELGDLLLGNLGWHGTFKTTGFNGKDPLDAGCRSREHREYSPADADIGWHNNFFLDARCAPRREPSNPRQRLTLPNSPL